MTESYAVLMRGRLPVGLFSDADEAKEYVAEHERLEAEETSVWWPIRVKSIEDIPEWLRTGADPDEGELPGPPADREERFEWILERAKRLDVLRGEDWIASEVRKLWNHPDVYEADPDRLYDVPPGVSEADYILFRLGVAFGTEYEHEFPRGRSEPIGRDDQRDRSE